MSSERIKAIKVVGIIIVLVGEMLIAGFVLKTLWLWFVVATFKLPELSVPAALGLSLLYRYMALDTNAPRAEEQDFSDRALIAIFAALAFLAIGFVLHAFM